MDRMSNDEFQEIVRRVRWACEQAFREAEHDIKMMEEENRQATLQE